MTTTNVYTYILKDMAKITELQWSCQHQKFSWFRRLFNDAIFLFNSISSLIQISFSLSHSNIISVRAVYLFCAGKSEYSIRNLFFPSINLLHFNLFHNVYLGRMEFLSVFSFDLHSQRISTRFQPLNEIVCEISVSF